MNDDNDSSINYNNNINSNDDDEDGDDINDENDIYTYNNVFPVVFLYDHNCNYKTFFTFFILLYIKHNKCIVI